MTKYLIALVASATLAASSQAAVTINLSGNPTSGPQFYVVGGLFVPDNSTVRLGTFAATPSVNATFPELSASFLEFGRIGSGTDNASGANTGRIQRSNIAGSSDATSPLPDSYFADKPVYLFVYGGDVNSIFKGVFGSNTTFKDQATAVSVSMGSFASAYGSYSNGYRASFTPGTVAGTAASYQLYTVPEPSAALLAAGSVLGLMVRRRR